MRLPLSSAILAHIVADCDGFAGIRSGARALSQKSNMPSIAVNEVHVALAAALLSSGRTALSATALSCDDEAVRLDTIERGMRLHAHALRLQGPVRDWHMPAETAGQIQVGLGAEKRGGGDRKIY